MKTRIYLLLLFSGFILEVNAQNLADSLAGYWPFTYSATDFSGNNNDGTVSGAILAEDRFGNQASAYYFDGVNDYITLPQDFDYAERTVCFWFYANYIPDWDYENDPDNSLRIIYTSDHPLIENGMTKMWVSRMDGQDKLTFHNGGYDSIPGNSFAINKMEWYFAAATITPDTIKYYLNDELLKTRVFPGNIHSTSHNGFYDAAIGVGRRVSHRFFNGKIDDVRIYNRSLSPAELKTLYNEMDSFEVVNDTIWTYDTITTEVFDTTYVTVFDSIAVTDTLVIDVTITDINQLDITNTIKVYPNPTKEIVYINIGHSYQQMAEYKINIINTTGSVIFETDVNQQLFEINVNDFGQTGLFLIQIIDPTSQIVDTRKILLE